MADETINIKIQEDGSRVVKRSLDDIALSADNAQTPIQRMTQSLKNIVMPNSTKQAMDAAKTSAEQLGAQGVATAASQKEVAAAISGTEQVAISRFASIKNAALSAFDSTRDAATHWASSFKGAMLNAYDTVRDAGYYWGSNFKGFLGANGAKTVEKEAATVAAAAPKFRSSSLAIRELLVIAREASVGNFTRMAGSVSLLAQAFGLLTTVLLPIAGVLAVLAAGMKLFQVSFQADADAQLKQYSTTLGLTSKEMRKLGDESVGAKGKLEKFNTIKLTFGDVFKGLTKTISDTFNLQPKLNKMKNDVYDALVTIVQAFFEAAAELSGVFVSVYYGAKALWKNLGAVVSDLFTEAANMAIKVMEDMVNDAIGAVNKFASGANKLIGVNLFGQISEVQLPRMKNQFAGAAAFVGNVMKDGYKLGYDGAIKFDKDFLDRWKKNSVQAGKDRLDALSNAIKGNRNPSKAKDPKTQADYIDDENSKLDKELSRMSLLKDAREEQQKLDEVEQAFIQRRMPLDAAQIKVFADKIHAIQEYKYQQQEMDRLYEQFNGAQKIYNASLAAATDLQARGVITTKQYTLSIAQAKQTLDAALDPTGASAALDEYKTKLAEIDVALENFIKTQGKSGITQQQASQQTVLAARAYQQATDPLMALTESTNAATTAAGLYGDAVQQNSFYEQVRLAFLAKGTDLTKNATAADLAAVAAITSKNKALQQQLYIQSQVNSIIDPILADSKLLANKAALYAQLDKLRATDLKKEADYARAKAALDEKYLELRLQGASSFFGELAQLSHSKNKELAAIGKAAAVAQATIDGVLAVQKALAQGGFWGIPMAAAIGVVTAANIAEILSTNTNFAVGGSFVVPGSGGPDSQTVALRLTPGEQVDVRTPTQVRKGSQAVNGDGDEQSGHPRHGNVKIVNVLDPKEALAALDTAEGERLITNIIERNRDVYARVLGSK